MKENMAQGKIEAKESAARSPSRKALTRAGLSAIALAGVIAILAGCQSTSNPQVAPTTDYPIHEASTITETYSDTSSSTTEQGVTPITDPTQAATDSTTAATSTTIDTATLAEQVIAGNWGDGQDRINALTAAGYNAGDIQSQVNDMLSADTTTGNAGTFVYTEPVQADNAASTTIVDGTTPSNTDTTPSNSGSNTDQNKKSNQTGATWHDEITEPIYEDQPVYKWNYTYTITKYMKETIGKTLSDTSDYTYATQEIALVEAQTNAQAALAKEISSATLANSDYTASSNQKQTGTKRVQTGTRIIQKAGWY